MVRPSPGSAWLRLSTVALSLVCLGPLALATPRGGEGVSSPSGLRVVTNVRLELAEDAPRVTLVLRHGRIEAVLSAGEQAPPGALVTDGKGALAVPAFIDAFSRTGLEMPEPTTDLDQPVSTKSDVRVDMREANRKGLRPALRAAELLVLEASDAEGLRDAGFGATLVTPFGELLAGSSALIATRDGATRDALLAVDVFGHASFSASGGGFPGTLMGYQSQLRQFFLDARHHAVLRERYAAGKPDPRPPVDADLEAALPLLAGERTLVCRADNARDIERWLALGDEAGFQPAISGGGEAWKLAALLAERDVPVFLTLDWGDEVDDPAAEDEDAEEEQTDEEVDATSGEAGEAESGEAESDEAQAEVDEPEEDGEPDWIYTEPLGVRVERRRLWEEGRDCALRLHEAGVRFAFGSGSASAKDLLKHVRELVEAGLPREVALAGLTESSAQLLGVAAHLGSIEAGHDATFGLWTDDPLGEDAELAWLFVDGYPHEYDLEETEREAPDEGLDATGTWDFEFKDDDGVQTAVVALAMNAEGDVEGTLTRASPMGEGTVDVGVEGFVSGSTLSFEGTLELGDMAIEFDFRGELSADSIEGRTTIRGPWGEDSNSTEATRAPEAQQEVVR